MKAILKNYRQSPRKVRLVANLIKGKNIAQADLELSFLIKRGALPLKKLLLSAVANAEKNFNVDVSNLIVKEISVDKGVVLKRHMPRARGSASRINKRSSHITIVLGEKGESKKGLVAKSSVAVEAPKKAPTKKAVAKKPAVKKVVTKTAKKSKE